jgi:hypothetical protein
MLFTHNLWVTPSWTQANLWTNTCNIIRMNCFKIRADKILDFSLLVINTSGYVMFTSVSFSLHSLLLGFESITDIHLPDS